MKPEEVREAWRLACVAWPGVRVSEEDFLAYVDERLNSSEERGRQAAGAPPHYEDLYLACACARGDRMALTAFEERFFPEVDAAVKRFSATIAADEIRQVLRHKLFVADPGERPKICDYSGGGRLRSWLRMAATRVALDLVARASHELPAEQDALESIVAIGDNPELAYFKRRYAEEFRAAFREAFAALGSRDRNLLRYAFGRGLTVDGIGSIYGVHRATAARWVARAHADLAAHVRTAMLARLKGNKPEYANILRLIESQLEISFDRYLKMSSEGRLAASAGSASGDDPADDADPPRGRS
jgi:RNA polymerase sigma-70 factor (ECF subfamily)